MKKPSLTTDLVIICGLALLLTGIGYFYLAQGNETLSDFQQQALEKRLAALQYASTFNGKTFPVVESWDAVTNEVQNTAFKGNNLVILLSKAGCNPCQLRELRNLDSLTKGLPSSVRSTAVYFDDRNSGDSVNRQQALLLRKATRFRSAMWHTRSQELGAFIKQGPFPMIFLLKDQTIVSSFSPIPDDAVFSQHFMTILQDVLSSSI